MMLYLDNNATTRPAPEVVDSMRACLEADWSNPSSSHRSGIAARRRIDLARGAASELLGCAPRELIFTSGGTEAANLAILGAWNHLRATGSPRTLLACAGTEHPAVLDSIRRGGDAGGEVVELPVDHDGVLDLDFLDQLLEQRGDELAICSVMWANNETGVIQPIEEIAGRCRARGVLFHTDAVQWVGREPLSFSETSIDLLSCSGHKFHGPKGAGALVVRDGVQLRPAQLGGPQERERRGGTENVAAIAGFGVACELARTWLQGDGRRQGLQLKESFERRMLELHEGAVVNGGGAPRLWNTTNLALPGLQAQALVVVLSERGLAVSGGAACASGSIEVSGVLGAMGVEPERAAGSLRISLSRGTTHAELDQAVEVFEAVLSLIRRQGSG